MTLSILKNASRGHTTYYVGENLDHVKHLKDCTLITKKFFEGLENVNQIIVENPQLEFYKLSNEFNDNFTFNGNFVVGQNCEIHESCVIGDGVRIGDNVKIGPNTVIYSNTVIEDDVIIGANTTVGCEGMMWVWNQGNKEFLRLLGGVEIHRGVVIGSNCAIVRGSANEKTIIETQVNLAPGCNIGHGTFIGSKSHLANNVSTGGSSYINEKSFLGSGVILSAGKKILEKNIIVGSGSVIVKDLIVEGVYVGNPARKVKELEDKLSGVPYWS